MTDRFGIKIISGVSHLSSDKEIVVIRFESYKHDKKDLLQIRNKYIQQANELVSGFLRIEKAQSDNWIKEARFILSKASYAMRQAHQADFWIKNKKEKQDE